MTMQLLVIACNEHACNGMQCHVRPYNNILGFSLMCRFSVFLVQAHAAAALCLSVVRAYNKPLPFTFPSLFKLGKHSYSTSSLPQLACGIRLNVTGTVPPCPARSQERQLHSDSDSEGEARLLRLGERSGPEQQA